MVNLKTHNSLFYLFNRKLLKIPLSTRATDQKDNSEIIYLKNEIKSKSISID